MLRRICACVAAMVALEAACVQADAYGPPFQVNGNLHVNLATPDNPDAAFRMDQGANGDILMMWQSGTGAARTNYVQRYDAAGRAQLNPPLNVGADARHIAVAGNGNYAILSEQPDGSGLGVFLTVYSRAHAVVVPSFRVNDVTEGDQRAAGLAINASGMIAVAWLGPAAASCPSLHVKRFHASGAQVAPEALVFETSATWERLQGYDVAIDSAGNYMVAFAHGELMSTAWSEVWAQRFSAQGVPLQPPFQVNSSTFGGQIAPRIGMNPSGSSIITWTGPAPDGADGLYGQRYSASGAAVGGELRINPGANGIIIGHGVVMDARGGFVVSWHDDTQPVPGQIVARAYDPAGAPLGAPFVVSTTTSSWPVSPAIGMDGAGNFVVAWQQQHFSNEQPSDAFARRYTPVGAAITPLVAGQQVNGLSGTMGSWRYFKLTVPAGHTVVDIAIGNGVGDADLYVRWGALPTLTAWDGRPYRGGNSEAVRMLSFPPGDWYIGIHGYNAYSGLSILGSSR